jgi:16S rRNA (uracil1498-N3)-methyltransferase
MPRWEKIAREASQQARRVHLPQIKPPKPFAEILATEAAPKLLLEESQAPPILHVLPREKSASDQVALLLGPEGGWTDQERERARAAEWIACSLCSTILRAETAAVAAIGVIQSAWASA